MKLVEVIGREHSRRMRDAVIGYVGSSQARFDELMGVFLKGPYRITQRAAWPLSFCVIHHPAFVKRHLSKLITVAGKDDQHVSVKRNVIRLMQFVDIPKSLQGKAADLCFRFLTDKKETIAVKAFSMTVLTNIAMISPELKKELIIILEDQLPYGSPGFINRANRMLKKLKAK